jgi:signal transduction histidine kinase
MNPDTSNQFESDVIMHDKSGTWENSSLENSSNHITYTELLDEYQRQAQELQLLHQIRSALVSNFDPDNVFNAVVECIASSFGYSLIRLYILEEESLELKAQRGYNKLPPAQRVDEGIYGLAIRTGKPILVPDVASSNDYLEAEPGVRSQICIPLTRRGNEVIGTLSIESLSETPLDERDLRLCQAAADHVILAMEQNRLYLSEQRRADQLGALNKIGRELVSLLNIDEIIDRITGAVRQKLNYYCVSLGLVVENELIFSIGVGEDSHPITSDYRVNLTSNCLVTYAYHNGELVLVHEVEHDERYEALPYAPQTKSEIVLPLRDANNIVGVLDIQSNHTYAFDDDEIILLKTLADQTSSAVANALRFQDIRRQKEELAETNQALAEANRLKNEFLANVSHELRTPLNSIMGYVDMIQSQFYGDVPESFNDPLERVERNSRRLLSLINDVLDLAKLEAGREQLQIETFWLEEVVRFVSDSFKEQAIAKNLTFSCIIAADTPKMVENDQKRVNQILTNLISNAVKFTHSGEVIVEVSPSLALGRVPGFMVQVKDTGIGISTEDYEHIFESFRQVDGSTTRMFGGAGMGLTICLKLVRMMHGSIQVSSEVGKGSIFTVILPTQVQA